MNIQPVVAQPMDQHAVCFQQNQRDEVRLMCGDGQTAGALSANSGMKNTNYICVTGDTAKSAIDENLCGSLKVYGSPPYVAYPQFVVRRLTPLECERLQGFPDGWTDIEVKGKPASDTARYKALGNSMAVPVMRWIGERIERIENEETTA